MSKITKVKTIQDNYQGKSVNKNSIVKFKTWKNDQQTGLTHSGTINKNPFSSDLTEILLQMKQGQKVELKLETKQKEEEKIILELTSVEDGQQFKQNYQKAEIFKNLGNQQIKNKNFQLAEKQYEKGLNLVEYDCSPEAQIIKISLLSNLTLAYLNTKKYQQCVKTCDDYLQCSMEPNKKIVWRKANANKNLRKWEQAENDINFGLQICENDEEGKKDFQQLSDIIKKQKKIQVEKEKKVYSKMFG